jgi:hypothetical protein
LAENLERTKIFGVSIIQLTLLKITSNSVAVNDQNTVYFDLIEGEIMTEQSIFGILWDSLELLGIIWNYFWNPLKICIKFHWNSCGIPGIPMEFWNSIGIIWDY